MEGFARLDFHADGTLAEAPIALCEVQGYVYDAKRRVAALAELFERHFWCDELSTYALALDGHKRPCRVKTSNAGHCLFTGIASPERARHVADTLVATESFSGWGIRTVASSEVRYNPMSYHNGSIWPHDNALIASGFARYGFHDLLYKPLTGLFDASLFVDLRRLPELSCGFHRRSGEGPTLYPVACLPQAWAAGAAFMLLQSCLGLLIDGPNRRVLVSNARLPDFLQHVRIENLAIRNGSVDLLFERHAHDVGVTVMRKQGEVEVRVTK